MASHLHILIVGAGIGGLMLAALLEAAEISYEVFEKSRELRPLGSALSISPGMMVLFEQLGLYQEMLAISKPFGGLRLRKEDTSVIGIFLSRFPGVDNLANYGDHSQIISRPDLVNLLLTRVPPHKIHFRKRVLSTKEEGDKVIITCSDNESYEGSILVGADGAYSSVRQNMYKILDRAGVLPKADREPLGYGYDCVVGVTAALDPKEHPIVAEEFCEFECVLGGRGVPYTWWFMPMTKNRIGWMITHDVRKEMSTPGMLLRQSEWGPDAALDLCNQVRHLACPYGGTVGDILDHTPNDNFSKVMLENKSFETWSHGRTVILGDACHKMLPFGGQGANAAMWAALHLANTLYDIPSASQTDITAAFQNYHEARSAFGKNSVNASNQTGSLLHMKGWFADFLRHAVLNWTPKWVFQKTADTYNIHRPQAIFLPFVKNRGTFKPAPNQPSRRSDAPLCNRAPLAV